MKFILTIGSVCGFVLSSTTQTNSLLIEEAVQTWKSKAESSVFGAVIGQSEFEQKICEAKATFRDFRSAFRGDGVEAAVQRQKALMEIAQTLKSLKAAASEGRKFHEEIIKQGNRIRFANGGYMEAVSQTMEVSFPNKCEYSFTNLEKSQLEKIASMNYVAVVSDIDCLGNSKLVQNDMGNIDLEGTKVRVEQDGSVVIKCYAKNPSRFSPLRGEKIGQYKAKMNDQLFINTAAICSQLVQARNHFVRLSFFLDSESGTVVPASLPEESQAVEVLSFYASLPETK
jgi:hypothetical protein